jgi:hypothetical protein
MIEVIHLQEDDDLAALRSYLRRAQDGRVALVLPWEARLFSGPLDGELVRREAERRGLEVAIVSEDPHHRAMARWAGLPVFASVSRAQAATWRYAERPSIEPPHPEWWEEKTASPPPAPPLPVWARRALRGARTAVFALTLLLLLVSAYVIVPRGSVTLVPASEMVEVIVPVSLSLDAEPVDTVAGIVPARQVGDYFEGYIEVETTGTTAFWSGWATGSVLFTNLLGQEVMAPAGTVVRTSAGGFPVRFTTTEEVVVPALGQAPASIEALDEGLVGNVEANQINRVEGIASLALRVTNPEPTTGGSSQEVRAVSQEDMDRARTLLTEQVLDEAYQGLQEYLEVTEFMPRQSLEIQASEVSYNRFLTERADTLGLQLRLLVTGLAVDRDNAEAIAYAALGRRLPSGYVLVGADFEIGEVAEEPMAAGDLTFFVTAVGYTAAEIDLQAVRDAILGRRVEEAAEQLAADLPLAEPARIRVWPEWLGRLPALPLHLAVQIIPHK